MKNFYFGYGSILNISDWERWCQQQGYRAGLLEPVGQPVWLPDHQLSFSHHSISRLSGVLNVHPKLGSVVQGMLFRIIDREGWAALDQREESPSCYQRVAVEVLDASRNFWPAQTYIKPIVGDLSCYNPTEHYVSVVETGMKEFGICNKDLQKLVNHEQPGPLNALFVYGTLMRNESRFSALGQQITCALLADIPGVLYDLGSYPGLAETNDWQTKVHGDFIRVNNIEQILPELDRIEGFQGFGTEGSLFARRLATVHVGEGRSRLAWTYVKEPPILGTRIVDGCWRSHHQGREKFLKALGQAHASGKLKLIGKLSARQWDTKDDPKCDLPREISELGQALLRGRISELQLAQASGIWTACCY